MDFKLNTMSLLLEPGNLDGLVILIVAIMFGPAILLAIIGFAVLKKNKKAAKVLFILAAVYLIVSLGICGVLMSGF
jgi:heme O synthase-like polyprenyltransferase